MSELHPNLPEFKKITTPESKPDELDQFEIIENISEHTSQGLIIFNETNRKLTELGLDNHELQRRRAEARQAFEQFQVDQHLNFLDSLNVFTLGASIDFSLKQLSNESKELYRTFITNLDRETHGVSIHNMISDDIAIIRDTLTHFMIEHNPLPSDLQDFIKKNYEIFFKLSNEPEKQGDSEPSAWKKLRSSLSKLFK